MTVYCLCEEILLRPHPRDPLDEEYMLIMDGIILSAQVLRRTILVKPALLQVDTVLKLSEMPRSLRRSVPCLLCWNEA